MALSLDSEAYREKVAGGIRHLAFCMKVYAWQHAEGRLFLHEHPHGAWSWKEPCVVDVLELEGVMAVVGDQCMFGQMVEGQFARKRTRWMTNCLAIAKELAIPCDGYHEHINLFGGRAKQTEKCSPRLVAAIL